MRDNDWLKAAHLNLWRRYFADVSHKNPVEVRFGRRAKYSLGSIRFNKRTKTSKITINGRLASEDVPEYVVTAVLAHEMVHYAQGFNSAHEKLQQYPHLGGVITRELGARGLGEVARLQKKWIKANWKSLITWA